MATVVAGALGLGAELTAKVKAALAVRSARKMAGALRVRVDPAQL